MSSLPTDLFAQRQLITNPVELIPYEIDAGFDRGKPDGVFFPESADELSRLVRWAVETDTPLVPRGADWKMNTYHAHLDWPAARLRMPAVLC